MKLIIAGSRTITDRNFVFDTINKIIKEQQLMITEVVSGGAKGVDRLGEEWAKVNKIPIKQFIPAWDIFGKAAGHMRNSSMAEYGNILIAFSENNSKGTQDMIAKATKKNLLVFSIVYTSN